MVTDAIVGLNGHREAGGLGGEWWWSCAAVVLVVAGGVVVVVLFAEVSAGLHAARATNKQSRKIVRSFSYGNILRVGG